MSAARILLPFEKTLVSVPADGTILYIRPQPGPELRFFGNRLCCEQGFRPSFDQTIAAGHRTVAHAEGEFAMVLVGLTRSREENLTNVARAWRMTEEGGAIVVDGAKTDGIESVIRALRQSDAPLMDVLSKSHGKVTWMYRLGETPSVFTEWEAAMAPRPNDEGFLTSPGMFSFQHADPGSVVLAKHLDATISGRVADLGAGWGWLSVQLLRLEKVSEIALFEAEHAAVEAAKANVKDPRARFEWADATRLQGEGGFDHVISNPPFHQGRAATPGLGAAFIHSAAAVLKPSGQFWLVANRQLPYESVLHERFSKVSLLEETASYKCFRAERPKRSHR